MRLGQVDADGSTLTVESQGGTTYTVTTSSSTTVTRTQTGSLADLAVGDEVTVLGETGSDGSVTAARISEGSGFVGGFRGGGNGPPFGGSNGNGTTPTTT